MGMIHKKSRTTGKRPRRTGEKVAQNTGTDFLALGLRVVLSLPTHEIKGLRKGVFMAKRVKIMTFPREGKFTSSHFSASKDVMGAALGRPLLAGNCRISQEPVCPI